MGVRRAAKARHKRPNGNDKNPALQAENSHCRWYKDGGKSPGGRTDMATGTTNGGRSQFADARKHCGDGAKYRFKKTGYRALSILRAGFYNNLIYIKCCQ